MGFNGCYFSGPNAEWLAKESDDRFERFIKKYNVVRRTYQGVTWRPEWLIGKIKREPMPSWWDHPSFWKRNGKPGCVVIQPYYMSEKDILDLTELCEKNGLVWYAESELSWHFPNSTSLIIISRKDNPAYQWPKGKV